MESTTRTKRHMSMNLEGCLRNFKDTEIEIFDDQDGNTISDKEAREYIAECIAKGWKVIPMAGTDVCKGFDYQTGCPGHPITEEQ